MDGSSELPKPERGAAERESGGNERPACDCDATPAVPALAAKELHEKLRPLLDVIPPKQRAVVEQKVVSVAMSVVEEYSGDILHPRLAKGWEELCPGAANRLLTMTEKQEDHRIWWERNALLHGAAFQYLGLIFALVVSLSLVGCALYCATINQPWVSGAFLAASAVGMAKAFLELESLRNRKLSAQQGAPPSPKPKAVSTVSNRQQGKKRR